MNDNIENNVKVLRNAVISGDTNVKLPPLSRIIRLFISSTLKDMKGERNVIMESLYPKLEDYCSKKGYVLQIIDLRWGLFEAATDQQLTVDICLSEVELAKELSNGPCFVAIISHRYGTKFVPRIIPENEYANLRAVCQKSQQELLDEWFILDENNRPPARVLKPIETEELKRKWDTRDNKIIMEILEKFGSDVFKDQNLIESCTKSVTELEVIKGALENKEAPHKCLVFLRNLSCFSSIEKINAITDFQHPLVKTYLDKHKNGINQKCYENVVNLQKRLKEHFSKKNLVEFGLNIDLNNSENINQEEIEKYLERFSDSFEHNVKDMIEASINRDRSLFHLFNDYSDLFHHLKFCHEKVKHFIGRHVYLEEIKKRLEENQKYLIIYGVSGSGKTSLTAKVATELRNWFPQKQMTIVLRFIGTSQDSYNIQSLLSSIIKQLSEKYETRIDYEKLWPINTLNNYFKAFLIEISKASNNDQIIILLDSLDQLSPEYDGRKLEWLPRELPENMTLIVSTLQNPEYEAFPALKTNFDDTSAFIELNELNTNEIREVIDSRLNKAQRSLKSNQMEVIENAFKYCSIPLYMKIVLDQAITWKSFENPESLLFKNQPAVAVQNLLEHIENIHGKEYVIHVLRYITLSRHGFYENHLGEILSNDENVRDYIQNAFKYTKLSSKLPQVLLLRLINSLKEYLTTPMYRWYHRMFQEVAYDRYCNTEYSKSNESCHSIIVKTFNHERFNINNPFWIKELPYHATCANDIVTLKKNYLLDLKFMQTKVQASDIDDLINDYQFAIEHYFKDDDTLLTIKQTLSIAAYKIRVSPLELPGQLYGRLCNFSDNKELQTFLKKCFVPAQLSIIPNKAYMAQPCKLLSKTLPIHKSELKSVIVSNNGQHIVTCASDGCIKLLNANDFTLYKTIYKRYNSTTNLTMSPDDTILYASTRITDAKSKDEAIIEAFEIKNGLSLFNTHSEVINSFGKISKHRHLLCSKHLNELWLVTKDIWFKIEWRTGQIDVKRHLPEAFSTKPDDFLAAATVNNRLICVLDIKPMVVSLDAIGSDVIVRDLKDETVMGRCILILPNGTVALSLRRTFKSPFDQVEEMEWHIMLCDPVTLDTIRMIPISKALNMWRCSLDGKIIYSRAFNYIYVIDIEEKDTKFTLEHSSQLNSCCALNDNTILSSTWDNKLNIWDLDKMSESKESNFNLFNTFNSRMIRFIYNDFNTNSRYAIFYNLFDQNLKELFLLYDICEEKVIRKVVIENYSRNDLKPVTFLSNTYVVIFCQSESLYYLVNIQNFQIENTFPTDNMKIFRRVDKTQIVMSIKQTNTAGSTLIKFDSEKKETVKLIDDLKDVQHYTINQSSIIYKLSSKDELFVFEFSTKITWTFSPNLNGEITRLLSSDRGSYIAITNEVKNVTSLYIFSLISSKKVGTLHFKKNEIPNIINIKFINDSYLIFQYKKENDRLTYMCDLEVKFEYLWFKDDDKIGNFDCLSNEDSNYIWYQRYQVNRMNQVKTDITVFHKNDIAKPLATLDADCRLKINQMALIDGGNAVIVKELDKLSFVTFSIRSEISPPNTSQIIFDSFHIEPSNEEIVFKKHN